MRPVRVAALLCLAVGTHLVHGADPPAKMWLTGTLYRGASRQLMLRAEEPIPDNATNNFVFLDIAKESKSIVFPICLHAAKDHAKLRLYGQLTPESKTKKRSPSFRFIVWRAHSPSDPDDLGIHDQILFGPDPKMPKKTQ